MKRMIPWLLLLCLAGAVGYAQEGMMAPPADPGQGGSMMMSGPVNRVIPFKDLTTARLLAAQGPTVLFFSASWCPTCRAAMRELETDSGRLGDTVVVVVDYDRSADVKKRYGVTYQHTWVQIDAEGRKLAVWSGGGIDEVLRRVVR